MPKSVFLMQRTTYLNLFFADHFSILVGAIFNEFKTTVLLKRKKKKLEFNCRVKKVTQRDILSVVGDYQI